MFTKPLAGFKIFKTYHGITGSLRHLYEFNQYPISEEMLLGLGAGVGFVYWHAKGCLPFLVGRANTGKPDEAGLEKTAGLRTGVTIDSFTTSSTRRAQKNLLAQLETGEPVMIYVDTGCLPYLHLPDEFHFGAHAVVVAGYDAAEKTVLLADRDGILHPVTLDVLAKARDSKFQPFPPQNRWFACDFVMAHSIYASDVQQAIREAVTGMLHPPMASLGVRGIRTAADRVQKWQSLMPVKELRTACRDAGMMIDYAGGTGGGLFRYMYGRFLDESTTITGDERLAETGEAFRDTGDYWQEVAFLFQEAATARHPEPLLNDISILLTMVASLEQAAWEHLQVIVGVDRQSQVNS